jgi:hypothetical protein
VGPCGNSAPHVFKNAVLAGRYQIQSYIQSGKPGRGQCKAKKAEGEGGKKREKSVFQRAGGPSKRECDEQIVKSEYLQRPPVSQSGE